MKNGFARVLVIPSFLSGMAMIFFVRPYVVQVIISSSPMVANDSIGKVYEYSQHGYVVFLSWLDLFLMNAATAIGFLLLVACGMLLKKMNKN
ncbi:hypothetical protein [Xanthomonas rydalmerensis]|uniref:Uncharacterized protein n=1 Tax=Xanthomonas rydalmerensis TaxID=3046274 RepID=A0ABZ0JJU2_9XANT|nr:hypothetical protein [Xanthomonas sp. DM-2023]WOS39487.1 hypothetical protein QN243_13735 [Xanthomonas sp. DM-2023]WOS43671.1 hypothetical protein QN242_13735 [Xanthomonas sp. DM-2023]WOS47852.1 hypothetical protein QN240_13735 [Xanthomonas sp. DM-2023]WOS52030.1 hypothetical protein QN244_13735 [Xanthomonas sp. DM-2023]WOS56214.1 hypothetical protein QN245_13735 [Xanthomonas sp. DM-2023]